jgi:hypothetical protein
MESDPGVPKWCRDIEGTRTRGYVAIATAGTYIVTLKSEGEVLLECRRAHLVVGLKP